MPRKAIPSAAPEYSSWSRICPAENMVITGKPSGPTPARRYVPEKVAVERNLEIVPRSLFASTVLCDGDRIEIVAFVGGG